MFGLWSDLTGKFGSKKEDVHFRWVLENPSSYSGFFVIGKT